MTRTNTGRYQAATKKLTGRCRTCGHVQMLHIDDECRYGNTPSIREVCQCAKFVA